MAMGMVAVQPTGGCEQRLDTGWRTWGALLALLNELGANTSSASMSNDGDVVTEQTSRDWARRLQTVIGRIDYGTLNGELVFVVDGIPAGSHGVPDFMTAYSGLAPVQSSPAQLLGPAETDEFIGELVAFFTGCGGFEQW